MKKLKIGIIGAENSHAKQFCEFFNKPNENGVFPYPDYRVEYIYADPIEASKPLAEEFNVELIDTIDEMLAKVDAIMITSRDGKFHAGFAKPFIEAGIPAFIDKPFTTDINEAVELVRLAKEKKVPLCGGSSLKYSQTIEELKAVKEELAENVKGGFMAAPLNFSNPYSDFWFYSSHLAEMCMEVFGWQPKSVVATENNQNVHGVVHYDTFSVSCAFLQHCYSSYSGAVFGSKSEVKKVNVADIARLESEAFVKMLQTGEMSHSYEQLIAPVAFISAVIEAYQTGKTVEIKFPQI